MGFPFFKRKSSLTASSPSLSSPKSPEVTAFSPQSTSNASSPAQSNFSHHHHPSGAHPPAPVQPRARTQAQREQHVSSVPNRTSSYSAYELGSTSAVAVPRGGNGVRPSLDLPRQHQYGQHQQQQQQQQRGMPGSSGTSWDDLGIPLITYPGDEPGSPQLEAPPSRGQLFGGGSNGRQGGSSQSLPLSLSTTQERSMGTGTAVAGGEVDASEKDKGKKRGWGLGRNKRAGSIVNFGGLLPGSGSAASTEKENSFVVRSFRHVSNVREDPVISTGPYESLSSPHSELPYHDPHALETLSVSPPLPPIPLQPERTPSPEPPLQRPRLNVRGPGSRSASPTISAEQFRFASARSRSTTSLLSTESTQRPPSSSGTRFELSSSSMYDSEASRRLRRGSSSDLPPPRPAFGQSSGHQHSRSEDFLTNSASIQSIASYTTAQETPLRASVYSFSPPEPKGHATTPSDLSDELKFIALYGVGSTSPTQESTPLPSPSVEILAAPPLATPNAPATSAAQLGSLSTPIVAVQPASPVPSTGSASGNTSPQANRLGAPSQMGGGGSPKGKAPVRKIADWTASDDEGDSDKSSDEDDDDVPLARVIASRSTDNLSLRASSTIGTHQRASSTPASSLLTTDPDRRPSQDLEVLKDASPEPEPRPLVRTQQRSVSTLSFANSRSILTNPSPPSPNLVPVRTQSIPAVPVAPPLLTSRSSARGSILNTSLPPPRQPELGHNSGSSSSGSGSLSSLPTTPKDTSPTPTLAELGDFGGKLGRTIQFELEAEEAQRERKAKVRMSTNAVGMNYPTRQGQHQRGASVASAGPPRSATSLGFAPGARGVVGGHRPAAPSVSQRPVAGAGESQLEKMKARHRAETAHAQQLGKDLNGPSIRDPEQEDDDDDTPLTALSERSRADSFSMYGGMPVMPHSPSMGMFSPSPSMGHLAMAPPGVDPYLYASLPPDQKMSLHHRSQQMMQMMAQASQQAYQASMGGWETGSQMSGGSSDIGTGPRMSQQNQHQQQHHHQHQRAMSSSMSMHNFGGTGVGGGMWGQPPRPGFAPQALPMMYGYPGPMPQSRLPPFAPSAAMGAQFFSPSPYAGFGGSVVGMPSSSSSSVGQRKGPASTIGYSRR